MSQQGSASARADSLGGALTAFIREQEYCGALGSGLEAGRVWMTCSCGALIVRALEPTT